MNINLTEESLEILLEALERFGVTKEFTDKYTEFFTNIYNREEAKPNFARTSLHPLEEQKYLAQALIKYEVSKLEEIKFETLFDYTARRDALTTKMTAIANWIGHFGPLPN